MAVFRHLHRVSYAECTLGDHVYYARYLDLLERARGEFFRQIGKTFLDWQRLDTIFPVVECRMQYHGAARYDDVIEIAVWVTAAAGVRLNFAYRIANQNSGGRILAAETFHACTTAAGKPKRLPADLVERVRPFVEPA